MNRLIRHLCAVCLLPISMAALAQTVPPARCSLLPGSRTCLDTTPCKTDAQGNTLCLAGVAGPSGSWSLAETCWQYTYTFACAGTTTDTCSPYKENSACALTSSLCSDTVPSSGACAQYNNTYRCLTQAAQTSQVLSCASGLFQSNALPTPAAPPSHFAKAAVAMEVIHEASTYNSQGNNLFSGVSEQCKKGWGGLKDCCKSSSGAQPNSVLMNMALGGAFSVVKYAGEKAVDLASPYVFDAMYAGGQYTAGMVSSLAASTSVVTNGIGNAVETNFAANGLSLGAYGFTYGTGSFTAFSESSMLSGNIDLSSKLGMGSGDGFVSFNPYVFAAMVALQVIQDLGSCEQGEQMLALHKGASLSVFVTESCSASIPIIGTCIEWTDHYCSFNSVLSKIINTQGKPQLGLNVADCSGLTRAQLARIDFSQMDFSEFARSQADVAQRNLPHDMKADYSSQLKNASSGSAQGKRSALPAYPPP